MSTPTTWLFRDVDNRSLYNMPTLDSPMMARRRRRMSTSGLSPPVAGPEASSADSTAMSVRPSLPVSFSAASGCTMRRVYTSVFGTLNWSLPSTKNGRRLGVEERETLIGGDLRGVGFDL